MSLSIWNDDDRDTSYMPIYPSRKNDIIDEEDEYIPIHKILKELYDEEKEALYVYNRTDIYNYYKPNNYIYYYDESDDYYYSSDDCDDNYDNYDDDESETISENSDDEFFENMVYNKFCYY
jgi:hypothetical protein